ncbi:Ros/MucR family transcriptional regulator [Sphingomonas sp. RS6]
MDNKDGSAIVSLATQLTIAWLGNHNTRVVAEEVPAFLRSMHATLTDLENAPSADEVEGAPGTGVRVHSPAVSVRKSLASPDYIISMIDGKPYRTLRRHLAAYGLSPEEYRARYNLRSDYPMVAESYSERRRTLARELGLGQKGRAARAKSAEAAGNGRHRGAG